MNLYMLQDFFNGVTWPCFAILQVDARQSAVSD